MFVKISYFKSQLLKPVMYMKPVRQFFMMYCSLDLEQWIDEPPSESEGEKFDEPDFFLAEDEKKR